MPQELPAPPYPRPQRRCRHPDPKKETGHENFIALLALVVAIAGCCATETDFKDAAEKAGVEAAETANPDFTATAECDEPSSTEVGTTFSCTITYNDGDMQPATAVILEDDLVEVTVGQ